jgi:N-methylhydantoinase A
MHAAKVADSLDVSSVIIPSASGVLSAVGGTMMDVRHNDDKTFYVPVQSVEPDVLEGEFEQLERAIRRQFETEDVSTDDLRMERVAEMRYVGQTYEVDVPVSRGSVDADEIDRLVDDFHRRHEQEYGIASDQFPITFVNLRVAGSKPTTSSTFQSPEKDRTGAKDSETRAVYFDGAWRDTAIHYQAGLDPGAELTGPAIVEGAHSTITLNPEMTATVDQHENVRITTTN